MRPILDLTGHVYGRLTVVRHNGQRVKPNGDSYTTWLCQCSCGGENVVSTGNLRSGNVSSCGCYGKERALAVNKVHGYSGHPMYPVWKTMIARCENPKNEKYPRYGARGIKVCERWKDFANFLSDMGEKPSPKHSIDRIDSDGDYEPSNCRWATSATQMRNTSHNTWVVYEGERLILKDAAARAGVRNETVCARKTRGEPEVAWFRPVGVPLATFMAAKTK